MLYVSSMFSSNTDTCIEIIEGIGPKISLVRLQLTCQPTGLAYKCVKSVPEVRRPCCGGSAVQFSSVHLLGLFSCRGCAVEAVTGPGQLHHRNCNGWFSMLECELREVRSRFGQLAPPAQRSYESTVCVSVERLGCKREGLHPHSFPEAKKNGRNTSKQLLNVDTHYDLNVSQSCP